jgi:hypothetical protein
MTFLSLLVQSHVWGSNSHKLSRQQKPSKIKTHIQGSNSNKLEMFWILTKIILSTTCLLSFVKQNQIPSQNMQINLNEIYHDLINHKIL